MNKPILIDTHCHINMMVKTTFDTPLSPANIADARIVVQEAADNKVQCIINVGTSLIESRNCIALAQDNVQVYAAIGIHPNDCTSSWRTDVHELARLTRHKQENKIVAIGECGLDRHYPDFDIQRQKDAFKAQIELALESDLALIVHTRDAYDETLRALEEFKGQIKRGVIHCFSEDQTFADTVISWGFAIGIGGTLTYPKNNALRAIAQTVPLTSIILETDAPFLPPQSMRGKQNNPAQIATIAHYLSELRSISVDEVAQVTSDQAMRLFGISE